MKANGRHLLVEYHNCDPKILNDLENIEQLMKAAAIAAEANIVQTVFHRFSPQGITGVVVVEESHLSVHTWPEYGYAAVDFFTCGECIPERARDVLAKGLNAKSSETMFIQRGLLPGHPSIQVEGHNTESLNMAEPCADIPSANRSKPIKAVACSARR